VAGFVATGGFDVGRVASIATVVAAACLAVAPAALTKDGPITKQNGSTPLFADFTSICSVPGYQSYGNCGGSTETYSGVRGRINAVQAKLGVWNLGVSFSGLEPGATYRLWGNRSASAPTPGVIDAFFIAGTVVASLDGKAEFSVRTSEVTNLGFDLNVLQADEFRGTTVVTSYWSSQTIQVLNEDGALYIPGV
jgi:hypothetical protein